MIISDLSVNPSLSQILKGKRTQGRINKVASVITLIVGAILEAEIHGLDVALFLAGAIFELNTVGWNS